MDDPALPTPDIEVPSMDPATLKSQIDAGDSVTILDVRMQSEYETWRIDGETVESVNVPYYEFLDDELSNQVVDRIPEGDPLVVVCAKGGASAYVAGVLMESHGIDALNLSEGMRGWARLYERHEITAYEGPGTVYQYHRPSSGCLGYLIVSAGQAAVIDPLRAFVDRYQADATALDAELTYAVDTHIHADHLSGVRQLADTGITGIVPRKSADRGITYADDLTVVADGDELSVGEVTVEPIATPGHTSDMTSYLVGESLLLTGDGLFTESVARPDLEEGDEGAPAAARELYDSLQERILQLPAETLIGGGHTSDAAVPREDGTFTASIAQLQNEMTALTMEKDEFVSLILSDMPPRPENHETIILTNLGQEDVDDETAFTLELGPNNCAASQESLATH